MTLIILAEEFTPILELDTRFVYTKNPIYYLALGIATSNCKSTLKYLQPVETAIPTGMITNSAMVE